MSEGANIGKRMVQANEVKLTHGDTSAPLSFRFLLLILHPEKINKHPYSFQTFHFQGNSVGEILEMDVSDLVRGIYFYTVNINKGIVS